MSINQSFDDALSRRELFGRMGSGLAGIALTSLLREAMPTALASEPLRTPHFAPQAKAVECHFVTILTPLGAYLRHFVAFSSHFVDFNVFCASCLVV